MSAKNFLDEKVILGVNLKGGDQVKGFISNVTIYGQKILVNVVDEHHNVINNVASFNCETPNGLTIAKRFFGSLLENSKNGSVNEGTTLKEAIQQSKNKPVTILAKDNGEYVNITLFSRKVEASLDSML